MGVYKGVEVKTPIRRYFFTKIDDSFKETYSLYLSNITSITPIHNPPKLLPVGTKVRVFEEYDYTRWKKEYEIDSISIWEYILKCRGSIFRCPFRAVVPIFD